MGNLLFIIRTLAITIVLILVMQIQWNGKTVEQRTLSFIRTSEFTMPIQNTAEAVTLAASKLMNKMKTMFNTKLFDNKSRSEKSESFFNFDRSEEYKEYVIEKSKAGQELIEKKATQGADFSKKRMKKFIDEVTLNSNADNAATDNDTNHNSVKNSNKELSSEE